MIEEQWKQWNVTTFSIYLLGSSLSLLATWELTWTVLQVTNTTLNVSGTQLFSVISKEDHYFPELYYDWRVKYGKQWNATTFSIYLLKSSLSLPATWELTWTVLQVINSTLLNVSGTQLFSVISKEDHSTSLNYMIEE